jgi:hypothetical protein
MMVMQLLLAMFWAGSCPVAMKIAVTMLAACALNPPTTRLQHKNYDQARAVLPMLPAIAEPIMFLEMLRSTRA